MGLEKGKKRKNGYVLEIHMGRLVGSFNATRRKFRTAGYLGKRQERANFANFGKTGDC